MPTEPEPSNGGTAPERDAEVLRRLEAQLFADPTLSRQLRRHTAALAGNTGATPPPSWWQMISCGLLLVCDAAVLRVAVNLNSVPLMTCAFLLFIGSAAPFVIKPRWQRRPRPARPPGRWRRPPAGQPPE